MFAVVPGCFLAIFGTSLMADGIRPALLGGTLAYIGLGAGCLFGGVLLINGKQYVVVLASGNGSAPTPLGDSVVAYSQPGHG